MFTTRAPYAPAFVNADAAFERAFVRARDARDARVDVGAYRSRVRTGASETPSWLAPVALVLGGGVLGWVVAPASMMLLGITGGAALGGAGAYLIRRGGSSGSSNALALPPGSGFHGSIVACSSGSPAPGGLAPAAGYASDMLFHWCYIVGPGDTAGLIAGAIVGDEARYQELILANAAHYGTIGTPGKLGDDEWNFAPDVMREGVRLDLPQTWNDHIDELGHARGAIEPFPEDRRPGQVAVAGYGPAGVRFSGAAA